MSGEETMRMILTESDRGEEASWREADEDDATRYGLEVYEVPADQVARWEAARSAWHAAMNEIDALVEARLGPYAQRGPGVPGP